MTIQELMGYVNADVELHQDVTVNLTIDEQNYTMAGYYWDDMGKENYFVPDTNKLVVEVLAEAEGDAEELVDAFWQVMNETYKTSSVPASPSEGAPQL